MTKRRFTHPKDAPLEHEWETVDGRKVTDLTHFPSAAYKRHSLAGIVDGKLESWTNKGAFCLSGPSNSDLVDAPKEESIWLNIYPDGTTSSHLTWEDAEEYYPKDDVHRIARVIVTYKWGQYDEDD